MKHSTPARVSTYAYVNPVVAIFLGALILHEPISPRIEVAALFIIAAVVIVTTQKGRRGNRIQQARPRHRSSYRPRENSGPPLPGARSFWPAHQSGRSTHLEKKRELCSRRDLGGQEWPRLLPGGSGKILFYQPTQFRSQATRQRRIRKTDPAHRRRCIQRGFDFPAEWVFDDRQLPFKMSSVQISYG